MSNAYFVPSLVNHPTEDPSLYVAVSEDKRALLMDCGVNYRLSVRALQKISHIFISHTHIDHFIGLDNVLRANIRVSKTIQVYGPLKITEHVHHKMLGYSWNLLCDNALNVRVFEISKEQCLETLLTYKDAFREAHPVAVHPVLHNIIYREQEFHVECAWLEHKIPCLGYACVSHISWRVDKERLTSFEHPPGPWIKDMKSFLEKVASLDSRITIGDREYSLAELKARLLVEVPGQKIAYVADTLYNPETEAAILALAKDADIFFCETHFAQEEASKAEETCHLTAWQAGMLARKAGAKKVVGFHFSPRYIHGPRGVLEQELEEAFLGKQEKHN
jgi:ribonuclease Z